MEAPGRSHQAPSMRLLGSMELWLANTFLPLLLLAWLPVGTVSRLVEPVTTVQSEVRLENLTVKCCKPECLEVENQMNTVVPGENSMDFTSSIMCKACKGICVCRIFITRPNSTDTGNSSQAAVPSCGSAESQTDVTGKICTGLDLFLCILFGLAVGTLLYMPVIGFLLWQCRRNRTGELMSGEVAKGNQAAVVAGTEDLTYANLNFEKTGLASSNVIYTEIKPSQQKQSGGDGSTASTEVDVSLKEEGR